MRTLLRHLGPVLLVAAIFAATAWWYTVEQEPEYRSQTTVVVNSTDVSLSRLGSEVDPGEVATQQQVMESPVLARQVRDDLGLELSPGELMGRVTVQPIGETRVLRVAARDTDADRAADIANGFAETYLDRRAEDQSERVSSLPRTQRAALKELSVGEVLTPAAPRSTPEGPADRMVILLAAAVGALLGLLLVLARRATGSEGSPAPA